MAADIHVNTDTGTAGGAGTINDPVDSMATVWANPTRFGSAPFTIYCSGVAVDNAGILSTFSDDWWTRSFTVIGDASGAAYDDTKYKLACTYATDQRLDATSHEFRNIQFKTTGATVFSVPKGGGPIRVTDCSIWIEGATWASTPVVISSDVSSQDFIATNLLISDALQSGTYESYFDERTIAISPNTVPYTAVKFFNLTIHLTKNTSGPSNYVPIAMGDEPAVFKNCILLRNKTDPFFYGQPLSEIRDSLVSGISTTGVNVNNDIVSGAVYDPNTLWADPANGDYTLLATAYDAVDKCPDVSAENGGITTDIAGKPRVVPWDRGVSEYALESPYPGIHDVEDTSQASDPDCIYFDQNVEVGNKFSYKTGTETHGWGVDIDGWGYPIIDKGDEIPSPANPPPLIDIVMEDDFNRPDSNVVDDDRWMAMPNSGGLVVRSQQCRSLIATRANLSVAKLSKNCGLKYILSSGSPSVMYAGLRFSADGQNGYRWEMNYTTVRLQAFRDGAMTQISSIAQSFNIGDVWEVRAFGNSHYVIRNGSLVDKVDDVGGIGPGEVDGHAYLGLVASMMVDDFSCGNLATDSFIYTISRDNGSTWEPDSTWAFGAQALPHPGNHEVTDPSQADDPNCIYYGQQVEVGNLISYKTSTETNGWAVSIDAQGYPIIDSGNAAGVDSFVFNISRDAGDTWEPEPPGLYTWLFSIQPTLSNPTTSAPTPTSTMISVTTNSPNGTLYAAVRTAAQGGAYTEGDQEAIRDATVGGDCVWKGNIVGPTLGVNQFEVTGLSLGTEYFYGFAQDAVSTS